MFGRRKSHILTTLDEEKIAHNNEVVVLHGGLAAGRITDQRVNYPNHHWLHLSSILCYFTAVRLGRDRL